MTLTLEINPDLELRLKSTARQRGLAADQCALLLLEERLIEAGKASRSRIEDDPLMTMAGVDDFEPTSIDEVVYR